MESLHKHNHVMELEPWTKHVEEHYVEVEAKNGTE